MASIRSRDQKYQGNGYAGKYILTKAEKFIS